MWKFATKSLVYVGWQDAWYFPPDMQQRYENSKSFSTTNESTATRSWFLLVHKTGSWMHKVVPIHPAWIALLHSSRSCSCFLGLSLHFHYFKVGICKGFKFVRIPAKYLLASWIKILSTEVRKYIFSNILYVRDSYKCLVSMPYTSRQLYCKYNVSLLEIPEGHVVVSVYRRT